MTTVLGSIAAEFTRYKALAEGAIRQLDDAQLIVAPFAGGNSVATIGWHIGGNLRSRFTDFLTSDGEKPWRRREEEFEGRTVARTELLAHWERGWETLFATLAGLSEDDLGKMVTIRRQPLSVHEALHRSLAHVSYHVGQIVFLSRSLLGDRWRFLSIPPGQSDAYNAQPTGERPDAHAARMRGTAGAVQVGAVEFHDESRCQAIEEFLADRVYEFNVEATGYADGKLLAGTIRDDTGEIIAGINGHTWGGCCEITNLWVHERHRGQGLGSALLRAAESEAARRGCEQVVLLTHSFQAPKFYERLGYERKHDIEGRPRGHADIVYVKRLATQPNADHPNYRTDSDRPCS